MGLIEHGRGGGEKWGGKKRVEERRGEGRGGKTKLIFFWNILLMPYILMLVWNHALVLVIMGAGRSKKHNCNKGHLLCACQVLSRKILTSSSVLLQALCDPLFKHLQISPLPQPCKTVYYYSHFTDEKTQGWRGQLSCLSSYLWTLWDSKVK